MTFFNNYVKAPHCLEHPKNDYAHFCDFQFFYDGANRLVYERGNWVLTTTQHPAKPCSEFEAKKTLYMLKSGEIKGFGYNSESLERALGMFNNTRM